MSHRGSVVLACIAIAGFCRFASAIAVGPEHTGSWFDPEHSGEGIVLEILDDQTASMYWYTYDDSGAQRWLFGGGDITTDEEGQYVLFPDLRTASGARFGPDFDPDDVEFEIAARVELRFDGCESGELAFEAFGRTGTVPLARLTRTMAAGCTPPTGLPGQTIELFAGESGSWFDVGHTGEGFSLQWTPEGLAILTWYTYDLQGDPYWLTGVGARSSDGRIQFPELFVTQGGRFAGGFDPNAIERTTWGSLELSLDCDGGAATYASLIPGFGSGEFDLVRLTRVHGMPCPTPKPRIEDLFDVAFHPLGGLDDQTGTLGYRLQSITDDGTVVASRRSSGERFLIRWREPWSQWELLSSRLMDEPFLASPDGETIFATEASEPGEMHLASRWTDVDGWQPLPNQFLVRTTTLAASKGGTWVAGIGRESLDAPTSVPWIWSSTTGQLPLPPSEEVRSGTPQAVSDDGNVAVGFDRVFSAPGVRYGAVHWRDGLPAEWLFDATEAQLGAATACDATCSIVLGSDQVELDPEHPAFRQPWFWSETGGAVYMGALEDADLQASLTYAVNASTATAGLVFGNYASVASDAFVRNTWVWTPYTGIARVRDWLAELDIDLSEWEDIVPVAVSRDGRYLLLFGLSPEGKDLGAVAVLTPKSN